MPTSSMKFVVHATEYGRFIRTKNNHFNISALEA